MATIDFLGSGSVLSRLKAARSIAACLTVAAAGSGCGNSGDEGTSGASPPLGSSTATNSASIANSSTGAPPSGPAPTPSNNTPAAVPGGPTATMPPSNPPLPSSTAAVPSGETPAPSSSETSSAAGGEGGTTSTGEGGAGSSGSGGTSEGGAGGAGLGGNAGASGSLGEGGTAGSAGTNSGEAGSAGASSTGSDGCGQTPTLMNSTGTGNFSYNTLSSGGADRRYILRWPEDYDNERPYRLILGFHGATNNGGNVAGNPAYFGLFDLAEGSTIFIAPDAVDGLWNAEADTAFVDDILTQVTNDLCIDTSRILLEGFSQGGAMVRTLACSRPGVFRAAVAHSAGGLALPSSCMPIPYLGSLGLQESTGASGQTTQTDFFAEVNGCTISTLPTAPSGGHVCTDYEGCSAGNPTRWCSFDGPHTPAPTEGGMSWMPQEVWTFFSQF